MAGFRGSGSWIPEVAACTLLTRYIRENFKIATFSRLSGRSQHGMVIPVVEFQAGGIQKWPPFAYTKKSGQKTGKSHLCALF